MTPQLRQISGPQPRAQAEASLVVGWDRRPASTAALRYCVDLAHRLTAHVHVVHIIDIDDVPLDPDAPDWEDRLRSTITGEAARARDLLGELAASWTYHGGHGSAAELLAVVAERHSALMVVIGSPRGGMMSYFDSMLGQSVARRMIGRSRVPVLLVPADSPARERDPGTPADT